MKTIRKAVLPVAALGTRFLPATKAIPKEMLPVVDRPLIQHVVDEAREAGIEHFIFVTGRNKAVIEDHFEAFIVTKIDPPKRAMSDTPMRVFSLRQTPGRTRGALPRRGDAR